MEMSQFLQLGPVKDLVSRYESQGWMLHDGLTPPMKGAIALQSHNLSSQEQAISSLSNQGGGGVDLAHRMLVDDIERQVQALIDRDTAADSSSFSIIDTVTKRLLISGGGVDGKIVKHTTTEEGSIFGAASVIGDDMSQTTTAVDNEIEGESVSYRTVEDDQDDEDFAAELEGEIMMADTSSQRDSSAPSQSPSLPSQKMSAIPFESGNSVVSQPNILSSQQGVEAISNSEMTMSPADRELQQKINERKSQLTSLTNPLIRARLEEVIRDLENNLAQRRGL